jgi:hypothetical protein
VELVLLIDVGDEGQQQLGPVGKVRYSACPRQFPHTFANVSDSPVHLVGAIVPGGIEEVFGALGAYLAQLQGPPDPGRIAAIWAGHTRRARTVGPPIEVAAAPAASSA